MKNSKPAVLLLALILFAGLAPAQSVESPAEKDLRAEALNKGAVKKVEELTGNSDVSGGRFTCFFRQQRHDYKERQLTGA